MISSYKLRIGDYDCWTVADGELTYPGSALLPPESEVPEEVAVPYTALLIDTGSARILIDTGAGALGPHTGKLPRNLTALGFAPEAIDFVVLSHAHPDHIAGVARFPNARIVLMRNEFEFWTAAETQSKLAAGELYGLGAMEQLMAAYVNEHLPSRPNLCLLDAAAEIQSGILVFPASGHTPGHAAVLISSGREQLLYLGDAVIHPAQFEHPDWTSAFDLLRDQTVNTRKQLLDRAASDRCLIAGFHLPGAVGAVESWRGRFRWEPGKISDIDRLTLNSEGSALRPNPAQIESE